MVFEERTLKSEMLYRGKILNLRRDEVTVKNGRTSYREIVEHNGGAVAAPITSQGKIVMVRQYRKPAERVVLEVPAGKIEQGEDPLDTIKRELREETGYTADDIRLMTVMMPSVGYTTEKLYIYLAADLTPGKTDPDENEALDVVEYEFDHIYDMVLKGEIEDAKTIIAVFFAKNYMLLL